MQTLVNQQTQILQGHNPHRLLMRDQEHKMNIQNPVPDRFYGIIGFWNEMYTGETVNFEEAGKRTYISVGTNTDSTSQSPDISEAEEVIHQNKRIKYM